MNRPQNHTRDKNKKKNKQTKKTAPLRRGKYLLFDPKYFSISWYKCSLAEILNFELLHNEVNE